MPDIIIVGSVALDTIKTPFGEHQDILGGAAVYSSYAASFFAKPGIVAVVGDDFPHEHLELLEKRGVDIAGVEKSGKTFRWSGQYEYDMNEAKTLATELGSFAQFRPTLPEEYQNAQYVFLANIDPELQLAVLEQVKNPKLVAMDSMNFWIETKKDKLLDVIAKVDVLFLNDAEARELFETPNVVLAAKKAQQHGPRTVIIKKGENGALMFMDDKFFSATTYPLTQFRDPTGAGDSFAGGFLGYLARTDDVSEQNVRRAVMYGSTLASFAVEDFSLERFKTLDTEQIEQRLAELRQIREF